MFNSKEHVAQKAKLWATKVQVQAKMGEMEQVEEEERNWVEEEERKQVKEEKNRCEEEHHGCYGSTQ